MYIYLDKLPCGEWPVQEQDEVSVICQFLPRYFRFSFSLPPSLSFFKLLEWLFTVRGRLIFVFSFFFLSLFLLFLFFPDPALRYTTAKVTRAKLYACTFVCTYVCVCVCITVCRDRDPFVDVPFVRSSTDKLFSWNLSEWKRGIVVRSELLAVARRVRLLRLYVRLSLLEELHVY